MGMFDGIARALGGFGAGVQGRGTEYLQQLREEQQSARLAELGNAVASGQIDRTQYLKGIAQYAPDLYGKIVLAQTQNKPSAIQEFEDYQTYSPQRQKEYMALKRALPAEKLLAKGVDYDPITGQANDVQGYGKALGDIAQAENFGGKTGALEAQLQLEPDLNKQNEFSKAIGKEEGEGVADLKDRLASLPQLEKVVNKLSDLGKKATYTYIGQTVDSAQRQAGMDTGEGAVARKEYISYVDNQVLPLLRQTFGAQFTLKEGENLKVTLGDPNATPEEKDAVLRSFIDTKKQTINSKERQYGIPETTWETGGINGTKFPVANDIPDEQIGLPNEVNNQIDMTDPRVKAALEQGYTEEQIMEFLARMK